MIAGMCLVKVLKTGEQFYGNVQSMDSTEEQSLNLNTDMYIIGQFGVDNKHIIIAVSEVYARPVSVCPVGLAGSAYDLS